MAIELESQQVLEKQHLEGGAFVAQNPLQDDLYIGLIAKVEEGSRQVFGTVDWETCLNVEFIVYGTYTGQPMKDSLGNIVEACTRTAFKGVRITPNFTVSGEPSAYRALLAYSTGQDVNEKVIIKGHDELVGKFIGLSITVKNKPGKNGGDPVKKNEITKFLKLSGFVPDEGLVNKALEKYQAIEDRRVGKVNKPSFMRASRTFSVLGEKSISDSSILGNEIVEEGKSVPW